jgi:PAS domain S-box-containing protein
MATRTRGRIIKGNATILKRLAEIERSALSTPPGSWPRLEGPAIARTATIAALRESEQRYRRLFEAARDGIAILDAATGFVTDVNPYLTELLGYTHAEIVGKPLWEFGPFRDTNASMGKFRNLQTAEYVRYDNLPLETRNHEIKRVEFVSNLYLVDGTPVVQCNIREISARLHAEAGARQEHAEMAAVVVALRERDAEMQALNRMNALLQSCTVKEEAYKVIALMAGDVFHERAGAVAIMPSHGPHLETVARWGGEPLMEPAFTMHDCWAIRRGQPHDVGSGGEGLLCSHFIRQPAEGSFCLPLTVQGETLGLLTLTGTAAAGESARRNERQLAESVGEAIKLSLSNLQLREKLRDQAAEGSLAKQAGRDRVVRYKR